MKMKYSTKTIKDCDLIIKRYELGKIKIIETWKYYLYIVAIFLLIIAFIVK
jgi:hypothetical protein